MGKGRDRRNRRDRFDDSDGEDYVPSYAPQSFGTGPSLDGTVKWFNADKGFGFVELADGSGDVFLHVGKLKAVGHESVESGTKLTVQVGPGKRGRQVEAVLSVDTSIAAAPRPIARPEPRVRKERDWDRSNSRDAIELVGTIKWYNPQKGFGFAEGDDGGNDVFIHASVLERSGLRPLNEGQRIVMKVAKTQKGREAISVALI